MIGDMAEALITMGKYFELITPAWDRTGLWRTGREERVKIAMAIQQEMHKIAGAIGGKIDDLMQEGMQLVKGGRNGNPESIPQKTDMNGHIWGWTKLLLRFFCPECFWCLNEIDESSHVEHTTVQILCNLQQRRDCRHNRRLCLAKCHEKMSQSKILLRR
jgi:hypothetical protein